MKKIKPDKVDWILIVEIVYVLMQCLLAYMLLAAMIYLVFLILKAGG